MTDLREQLADRILDIYSQIPAEAIPDPPGRYLALIYADEVVRQMAWASFQATLSHRASEGYDNEDDAKSCCQDFVTLAPIGWTP